MTTRPLRSTTANTSDIDGWSAPGKMYLRMNGLIDPGSSLKPQLCSSATPSSASSSLTLAKNSG